MSFTRTYDAVIVGAGVIGCCAARELSRYKLDIAVLEAGPDIAMGATRANSGIVHTGYDPAPGTLKAAYNVRGAKMFAPLQRELGFAYRVNGALVLAFSEDEVATLEELRTRAQQNGAPEVFVIGQDELRALEPNVAPEAIAALHVPDSAVCDPYGFTYGMAENAADNGVEFLFNSSVSDVSKTDDAYVLTLENGDTVHAKAVVNAAGVHSDELNNMVSETKLRILVRRGEYHLFKNDTHAFSRTMFQAPTAAGKGVLVGMTAFGNQFIGPNSAVQESKTDVATTEAGLAEVMECARRTWPDADTAVVISNFTGLRATNADAGDFVIGEVADASGFFNAACIDSPGLASAPAIGCDLAAWVADYLSADANEAFNPIRVPAPLLAMMDEESKAKLIEQNPLYGKTICGCAKVSEGEVVDALHRSLPATCVEAVKWRTGATMGPCQGGRCIAGILKVMARELGVDETDIVKRAPGSTFLSKNRCACEIDPPERIDGGYEKPRAMYKIAGARPSSIYSAYGAQMLMARTGYLPGENVMVWGSLPNADECAKLLEKAGASVVRVVGGEVVSVQGEGRVSEVVIAQEDGTRVVYECDALVMSDEMLWRKGTGPTAQS